MADLTHRPITSDAVVVVPGIMGTELREAASGRLLWGLSPVRLAAAWTGPLGLEALHLTPAERAGEYGRVAVGGLLRAVGYAPFLRGIEPYTKLLAGIANVVADPAAVLEFGYDWRLPVAVNGARLALAARNHLTAWQAHPAQRSAGQPAQLVFVAHSMGGLVTLGALHEDPELSGLTRAVVTLGTPYRGSVQAVTILNSGLGGPPVLPRQRMRELSVTLPGVHDLLPRFACLDQGRTVEPLTPEGVGQLGGDAELARTARRYHRLLDGVAVPGLRAVVGVGQPTVQSVRVADGVAHPQQFGFTVRPEGGLRRGADDRPLRTDLAGDGTVHLPAASRGGPAITYLPVAHGALGQDESAIQHVCAVLTEQDHALGPPMGDGDLGLDLPDLVEVGSRWTVTVRGAVRSAGLVCTVQDIAAERRPVGIPLARREGAVSGTVSLGAPGLYRVSLDAGRRSPITQVLLAGGVSGGS
ncbi:hypothetical protein ACFZB9_22915 [Kitasatospora sp. NPDC008050]|uniref:lipase/acyltransferase domain-containing protein n=1 Tax=Kitasatospora sp. NPDC008050 TaxID=3364021 RepID=UPI0036EA51F5